MENKFNWRNCWYPVIFMEDLPKNQPYSFSIYDQLLVLVRNENDKLSCLNNRCPHRATRLSDGQINNGKIECLYHGWQFNFNGECIHIPQLPQDNKIPGNACVKSYPVVECQGMVWVWFGEEKLADLAAIPTIKSLDKTDVISMDYAIDLPYDQTYLIENVIDVAHIHIAHDGIRGGGKREYALPLEFEILENSVKGIKSKFRSMGLNTNREKSKISGANVEFIAPNLVLYTSNYSNNDLCSGLALYSLPLGKSKCRLIYRKYSNFWSWKERLKPRWLEHWNQNTILQQDMAIIMGQYAEIEQSKQNLKELWLPLKTCDTLVIEYRKWLDKYGLSLPFYRGYSTAKNTSIKQIPAQDTFSLHTKNCHSCLQAYHSLQKIQQILILLVILNFSLSTIPLLGGGRGGFPQDIQGRFFLFILNIFFLSFLVVTQKIKQKF